MTYATLAGSLPVVLVACRRRWRRLGCRAAGDLGRHALGVGGLGVPRLAGLGLGQRGARVARTHR